MANLDDIGLRVKHRSSSNMSASKSTSSLNAPKAPATPSGTTPPKLRATGSATGNPRNKCALQPGHSLMDWIRLGSSGRDLTGVGGRTRDVTRNELATHNKEENAWLAIRGKVYNVTHYMPYHPGGRDELMRAVGKDATDLFDQVHAWVNYESLLSKCYIGPLCNDIVKIDVKELFKSTKIDNKSDILIKSDEIKMAVVDSSPKSDIKSTISDSSKGSDSTNIVANISDDRDNGDFKLPLLRTVVSSSDSSLKVSQPRFDWIQKTQTIVFIFYTKSSSNPNLNVHLSEDQIVLTVKITFDQTTFFNKILLKHKVQDQFVCCVSQETGKIEIKFDKEERKIWDNFGVIVTTKMASESERIYVVSERHEVGRNTWILVLKSEERIIDVTPIGHHVKVTCDINGTKISRSYTPIPSYFLPTVPSTDQQSTPSSIPLYLLIKKYQDGALTPCLTKTGRTVYVSEPRGNFKLNVLQDHRTVALLAAGTGITPMLGLAVYLLERRQVRTQAVHLYFFNRTMEDILCRAKLDELSTIDERLKITYILSDAESDWTGHRGHVTEELVAPLFTGDNPTTYVCICGPTVFTELARSIFMDLHLKESCLHCFLG